MQMVFYFETEWIDLISQLIFGHSCPLFACPFSQIELKIRKSQSGLGAGAALSVDDASLGRSKAQRNWEKARERFADSCQPDTVPSKAEKGRSPRSWVRSEETEWRGLTPHGLALVWTESKQRFLNGRPGSDVFTCCWAIQMARDMAVSTHQWELLYVCSYSVLFFVAFLEMANLLFLWQNMIWGYRGYCIC